jgi:hypothetical protein
MEAVRRSPLQSLYPVFYLILRRSYCTEMSLGDWKATIQNISRETMMDFFLFVCENSKIKSRGSSEEYIRQFSQLHTTVTGRYIDRNDRKELSKVRHIARKMNAANMSPVP